VRVVVRTQQFHARLELAFVGAERIPKVLQPLEHLLKGLLPAAPVLKDLQVEQVFQGLQPLVGSGVL
jgi:hypothetical protein